ncbi:hypothetical protein H6G11_15250 [Cyanobacterium aponinum FACHB-4101]|uniref:hypothetical protein n=1 Tax=Cyanobacterium aponinum TaxID=379064 RepID=UPI0016819D6D|nr:hypothetical protein [Cyanobacterium aponinum]MBD2395603.1 hypothetical protein [Cyanobacterium aponinum FACHB-4101]
MTDFLATFNQIIDKSSSNPSTKNVYEALILAEKYANQNKIKYDFSQLLGSWQLCFITGTKKSQQQRGNFLKNGFYLPAIASIIINDSIPENLQQNKNQGIIENIVKFGLVQFNVSGICKFINNKNILAFDFLYLKMFILGAKVYETEIRGGKENETTFWDASLKDLAFFSYFLVDENFICARGKGGGLAFWKKK